MVTSSQPKDPPARGGGELTDEVPHSPCFDLPGPKVDLVKITPGRGYR